MIKLVRADKPSELTAEVQKALTDEFIKSNRKKTVWKKQWISTALLSSSFGKCAFSEVRLEEEGKYMEVEHFHPKSLYPELVVEWTNLLPILNHCNRTKGDCDPQKKPLVNPMDEDPKLYFIIRNGRILPRDKTNRKAINTIEIYGLNDYGCLRKVRYSVECRLKQYLSEYFEHYTENRGLYAGKLLLLMTESGRTSEYSATKSTVILLNEDYKKLKALLKSDGLWNGNFDEAERELEYCALI